MEEELPTVIAKDPKRGPVGDRDVGGGAVGGESNVFRKMFDEEVMNRRGPRLALEQDIDDLLAIEDAAGAAELPELFGKERDEGGAVMLAVGVEEPLFERVEMVLELRVCHAMRSYCYTDDVQEGFRSGAWRILIERGWIRWLEGNSRVRQMGSEDGRRVAD
jgi:hypothetical protein